MAIIAIETLFERLDSVARAAEPKTSGFNAERVSRMTALRVGIVGAGFAAEFHLTNLRRVYGMDVEIAGVTSLRAESRADFGRRHGIKPYADAVSLIQDVDVIDICSPPSAHDEAMIAAAAAGKHIICEKPLSGYFGPEGCGEEYHGNRDPKGPMLEAVIEKLQKLAEAVRKAGVVFGYAENFVYAPAVRKEAEIIRKTGAQVLRMLSEESHGGSASDVYGIWRFQGGGALMGKGCHPLSTMLYLKRVEGLARNGKAIRPKTVTCRCETLTHLPNYEDKGFLRTEYHDTEDNTMAHVVFEDGTVADLFSGEVVMGGLYSYLEVFANNHRTRCNLSPAPLMETYNPSGPQFADVYTVEKISTKEGWTTLAPEEGYTLGYADEMQDFLTCAAAGDRQPAADLDLALDTITTIYAAYLSDEQRGAEQEVPLL